MKTITVKDAFYIATAPYNREIVIIADVGEYGCLKILANSSKYFKAYEPQFQYFNGKSLKKITKTYLKSFFTKALKFDPTYFSISELKTLGEIFKVKVENHLSEQLKIKFRDYPTGRAWSKEHYNRNYAEKWEANKKRKVKARNERPATKKAGSKTTIKRKTTTKRK
jgi:hypothetical protein